MYSPLLFLLGASACKTDCPPGSARGADGLCYLADTDTGSDTEPPIEGWRTLPLGCGLADGGPDPITHTADVTLQPIFAELVDVVISEDDRYAFATGYRGLVVADFSDPTDPTLLYDGFGTGGVRDGRWDHVALGPDGMLYATDYDQGLFVLDRSDPAAPEALALLEADSLAGMVHSGEHLFVTRLTGELVVYSTTDPRAPEPVATLSGLGSPRRLVADGERLYVADNTLGVVVVDVSAPDAPRLLHTASIGGVQEVDLSEDGSTLYAAAGGDGVAVLSLDNPDEPVLIDTITLNYSVISLDADDAVLWAANQQDVVALDISAPQAPTLINTEQTPRWAMHVASRDGQAVVADWANVGAYDADATILAPDAAVGSARVFLGPGENVELAVANLGGAPLELLGAASTTGTVRVEADRGEVAPGERGTLRLTHSAAAASGDIVVCLSTNDPDQPDTVITVVTDGDGGTGLGSPAPDFTLEGLDGQSYTLSDQRGKPVVLAYFATW